MTTWIATARTLPLTAKRPWPEQGDRVAVMMPIYCEYPVAIFGILRAGLVVVNVNRSTPARTGTVGRQWHAPSSATLQQVLAKTPVETVITRSSATLPEPLVNAVVKYRRMVPKWDIGSVPLRTALVRGKARLYHRVALTHQDTAFLHTPAAPLVFQGAQPAATSSPTWRR